MMFSFRSDGTLQVFNEDLKRNTLNNEGELLFMTFGLEAR